MLTSTTRREERARVTLGTRWQITLPQAMLKRLEVAPGEEVELGESEKAIVLIPRNHIPQDQPWDYRDAWQRRRREAFEADQKGQLRGPCERVEEFQQAVNARTPRA